MRFRAWFRTSRFDACGDAGQQLKQTLSVWHLAAIGIGCMVGVGIFVLPGVEAAQHAGPGIVLSFLLAALAVSFAALAYAELAAMLPIPGGAYAYSYATLGELPAWLVGWTLLLEYQVAGAMVSIGWSAYLVHLLQSFGIALPHQLTASPFDGQAGLVNLPAILIVWLVTLVTASGVRESAQLTLVLVVIKVVAVVIFLGESIGHIDPVNWSPFLPFGFNGVLTAASVAFIAFGGFEAMTTAAAEAKDPQRDIPRALLLSLVVVAVAYMAVALAMTGVVPFHLLDVADPMVVVLTAAQHPWVARMISSAALFGIASVLLALFVAQPRILFAMAHDGLLPKQLAQVHPRLGTPLAATLLNGGLISLCAGFLPIQAVAELCSVGFLSACLATCLAVLVLRTRQPERFRPFKVPKAMVVLPLGVATYAGMLSMLPAATQQRYAVWTLIGAVVW